MAVVGAATTGYLCYQGLVVTVPYALLGLHVASVVVGLAMFVFMVAATVVPFAVIGAFDTIGLSPVLALCAAAVGLPALVEVSGATIAVLVGAMVRGAAFGVLSLVTAVAVVRVAPPDRTGRWLGIYGFATSAAAVVGQPLGLELAGRSGSRTAVLVLAMIPFAGVVPFMVSGRLRACVSIAEYPANGPHRAGGRVGRRAPRRVLVPLAVIAAVTAAMGVVVTFGGSAVAAAGAVPPSVFFLLMGLSIPIGRLLAGHAADRGVSMDTAVVLAPLAPLALLVVAGSLVAMLFSGLATVAVLMPVAFGVAAGMCISGGQVALVREHLFPSVHRATAWFGAAWNIPMGVGALVAGVAGAIWSPRAVIAASAAIPLAAAVAIRLSPRYLPASTPRIHFPLSPHKE
jgi:predicted MFS family arabinose efflux permease